MNKLELIQTFAAICENGSLRAAADDLGIDASRVGQRLKELEAGLGTALITRSTRSMSLTEPGKRYLAFCQDLLTRIDAIETDLRAAHHTLSGQIKISAPPFLTDRLLGPIMSKLAERLPDVRFDLVVGDRFEDMMAEGIDIAIRSGDLPDSQLMMRRIYAGARGEYASPAYLERAGRPIEPSDLADHKLLVFSAHRRHLSWQFSQGGRILTHRVAPSVVSNNLSVLLDMATSGQGILRVSDWVIQAAGLTNQLELLLPEYVSGSSQLTLVYPRDTARRKINQIALDSLTQLLRAALGEVK